MVNYYRPAGIKKVLSLLANHNGKYVLLYHPPRARHVTDWLSGDLVDLSEAGLDKIVFRKKEAIIGSMVSLESLYQSEAIRNLGNGVLSQAAKISATQAMRNLSTLGGVLLNPTFPAEVVLALLVMDAHVLIIGRDRKETRIPVEEFVREAHPQLEKGTLLGGVAIPLKSRLSCVMDRVARTKSDTSIVSVVAAADKTQRAMRNIKIAIFGASPLPKRYHIAESFINAELPTDAAIEKSAALTARDSEAYTDYRGSAEYRKAMAETLTRRALQTLKRRKA